MRGKLGVRAVRRGLRAAFPCFRLTAAEMAALVDGLDWRRVHGPRDVAVPRLAG